MEHLIIFAYVIILLVGLWVIFTIRQYQRKQGLPLFRHLFHYAACFNILLFLWLAGNYSTANLLGDDKTVILPEISIPLILLSFVVEVGLVYSLLQVVSQLKERQAPALARRTLAAGTFLFGASYIIGATLLIQSGAERWFITTHILLMVTGSLWIMLLLASLLRTSGNEPAASRTRVARAFALLLLPGYLVLFVVFALPAGLHYLLAVLNPLWLNLAPLIWLRRYWPRSRIDSISPELGAVLASLGQARQITRRELEIMELILGGKSNKEIEQQLCISFNTVKNHIYNLYRKLDVNSRGQLVSLVLSEQRRKQI